MITAITTCMGRKEHLETTLPLMLNEFERVIVVDWSCPQKSGEWALKQGADVFWRAGERYFSASRARNLGASKVAQGRTICFLDVDTIVMPGLKNEIESLVDLRHMVVSPRNAKNIETHDLGGFIALDIGHFWGVGGYNEALEGYGFEDSYLRAQLCLERGLGVKRVSSGKLAAIRHTHQLRGQHHREPIEAASQRNHNILLKYLAARGVTDWTTDPRTSDAAHRTQ